MTQAHRYLENGLTCPKLIVAGQQNQGRGRYGKHWVSPKGNLYCSYVCPILGTPQQMSVIFGVVLARVLTRLLGPIVAIKYPNDILIQGKKIAGILVEPHDAFFVIGMGVNIAFSPSNLTYETTCFSKYRSDITLGCFVHYILREVARSLNDCDFREICNEWRGFCGHMNQFVHLSDGRSGIFWDITEEGLPKFADFDCTVNNSTL